MKRLAFVLLAATSIVASVAGAQIPDHLAGRPVRAVRIEGETSGATSAADVGIEVGAPLSRALLRAAALELLETGRWADVQMDVIRRGAGVEIMVRLTPRILITRVDVLGNEALDDETVRSHIRLGPDGALESDLDALSDAVAEIYAERGYTRASVEARLRDTDDPSRKVLRVHIEEDDPDRVSGFAFPGDRPPQEFDLPDALGLHRGDIFDRGRLREGVVELRRRLRRQGWLEARLGAPEARATMAGIVLIVPLRLGPRYMVRVVGHEPLERTTVEEVLDLEERRLTRRTLEELRGRVLQLMQRHGYRDAEVELARFRGEGEGTAVLEVRIRAGRPLHVIGMSFPGASHFESEYLRSQVVSVLEEGLPDTRLFGAVDSDNADRIGLSGRRLRARREIARPLDVDPSRVFYAPLYEQAVEHLREVYDAAGYLSTQVGPVRIEPVGRGRAVVVLPVVEGPRTELFDVALQGNEVISAHELVEASQLRRHEPFSYLGLDEALRRMTERYRQRGYIFARIEPEIRFSQDRERAEIVLSVTERFEVHFGEVVIEGLERTSESLVRDALRIREGAVFLPEVVRASQDALMALGVFTSVNIAPSDPDLPERVKPVRIIVHERDPQYVDIQLGLSTGQGLRGGLEYGYRNLFGYALGVIFRAQLGFQFFFQDGELQRNISNLSLLNRLERRVSVTFALPQIAAIENVRAALDFVHLRDNQRVFGLDKNGVVLSFNWRPLSRLTLTWSVEGEHNGVQLFGDRESIEEILEEAMGNPQVTNLLRVPAGESFVVSSRIGATLDRRDSSFTPTDGWFLSGSAEWALTPGSIDVDDQFYSHFLKLGGTVNGYIPIGDLVIAGQIRVGGIVHVDSRSNTYPNRQFFLGGVDTMRGFNQDQLQPQDIAEFQLGNEEARTNTVLQGGDFFYLARVELRFPIFGGLHGGLFTDLGNHWVDPRNIGGGCDAGIEACLFVRPTAGLGLRIATPVGPLALDYGFNLLRRQVINEPFGAFHFSIGVF